MTQLPSPSWGLDRIDQRSLPTKDADPFFAYGDEPMHGVEYALTVTDTETGAVRVHADPFFAYGDGFLGGVDAPAAAKLGVSMMYILNEPEPIGDLSAGTPGVEAIGLRYHAEFIYY